MLPIIKIITAPENLPLSLEDIKGHLRIDTDDDDALLMRYLQVAVERVQALTGLFFLNYTVEESFDRFFMHHAHNGARQYGQTGFYAGLHGGCGEARQMRLGAAPVQSVNSVKYYDSDGVLQTVDPSLYFLEDDIVYFNAGFSVPSLRPQGRPVRINYIAGHIPLDVSDDTLFDDGTGFDDSTGFVGTRYYPEQLKQAVRQLVGFFNEAREEGIEQHYEYTPVSVKNLLINYKRWYL